MTFNQWGKTWTALALTVACTGIAATQDQPVTVSPHWDKVVSVSHTTPDTAGCSQSSPSARYSCA